MALVGMAAFFGATVRAPVTAMVLVTARLPGSKVLKPALGGLAVGLLALVIPQILSSGYGWAQKATATDTLMAIPLWIVLILPLAKIVATSLSIGTGGSAASSDRACRSADLVTPARCAPRTGTPTATSSPTACRAPRWCDPRQLQQVFLFTVSAGEMFHIDSGSLHHIENIGDERRRVHPRVPQRRPEASVWRRRSAR